MIDANAYVGEWPFRRLPQRKPEALLRKMDALGIERAVVSRLENVFLKDLLVGNRELHAIVRRHPDRFIPAYTINPAFPGWREDLQICIDELGMRHLRLHPNYHQYRLLDANGQALLEEARARDFVVLATIGLEDPRHHHWLCKVPNVPAAEIAAAADAFPDVRLVAASGTFSETVAVWQRATQRDHLYVENSRVQGPIGDVEQLCALMGAARVLFGSSSPLLYPESAKLSIEAAAIPEGDKQQIFHDTAARLFGRRA